MDTRARRFRRYLAYAGLALLAAATIAVVVYLIGTPAWDSPMRFQIEVPITR